MWETMTREIALIWPLSERTEMSLETPYNSLTVTNSASHPDYCIEVQFYSYSRSKKLVVSINSVCVCAVLNTYLFIYNKDLDLS